ncbi:hypothetical protein PFISCL1PPCAC_13252, partial [Pristionchus fissidentatus]
ASWTHLRFCSFTLRNTRRFSVMTSYDVVNGTSQEEDGFYPYQAANGTVFYVKTWIASSIYVLENDRKVTAIKS